MLLRRTVGVASLHPLATANRKTREHAPGFRLAVLSGQSWNQDVWERVAVVVREVARGLPKSGS